MKRRYVSMHPRTYVWLAAALFAGMLLTACTRERPSPGPGTLVPAGAGTMTPSPNSSGSSNRIATATVTPATAGIGARLALPTLTTNGTAVSAQEVSEGTAAVTPLGTPEAANSQAGATPVGGEYTVQAGDTLSAIARRFGLSVTDLIAANQIANPNTLHSGQVVNIPAPGAKPAAATPAGDAAATPAQASTQAGGQTQKVFEHVVKPGETLYSIAQRYGVPLDKLAIANNITNPSLVRVGQRLTIPSGDSAGSSAGARRVHVVQKGETLTSIAARYGVTPQQIRQANNLQDPRLLMVGQQLVIP